MEAWILYLVNIFLYVITVPCIAYEKYLRSRHSKTFIKKTAKKTAFIRRLLYLDFKGELPTLLFVINAVYYITWVLCGVCLLIFTLLNMTAVITAITVVLIVESVTLILIMWWQLSKQ